MRILQVCPGYYPSIGGVEEHVKNIAERLAKRHQVTVFTCDPSGKLETEEKINGVTIKRFKSYSPANSYHLSFELLDALKKSDFDIVHGHNYHAFPLLFSSYARASKFVVTPHYHRFGHTFLSNSLLKLYKIFSNNIFQKADQIIAVSNYEKELLTHDFKIEHDKIQVIPNGINLSEYPDKRKAKTDNKMILYVGRLEKYKGVQYIIETLPLLNKSYSFMIVGKGQYKARLVNEIEKLGLSGRVTFYQDLPRERLLKAYAEADIFINLSQLEAFSIVVAEALASKIPCIVANTSALSEWIDNKNCFGINYPINNDELKDLVNRVVNTKVEDLNIWDWDKVVEQLEKIYR